MQSPYRAQLKIWFAGAALLVSAAAESAGAHPSCQTIFVESPPARAATITDIARLRISIDELKVKAHSSSQLKALKTSLKLKEQEFQLRTQSSNLSKLIRAEVSRLQTIQDSPGGTESKDEKTPSKTDRIRLIATDGSQLPMNWVEPGLAKVPFHEIHKTVYVETHVQNKFALAAVPTSQYIWKKVIQAAKKQFPERWSQKTNLDENPSVERDDFYPVTNVSFPDVMTWIDMVNDLARAEDQTFLELFPDHIRGATYRLPTDAEWALVATNHNQLHGRFPFPQSDLDLYAWYRNNSLGKMHPVGMKSPIRVDQGDFFDVYGLVWQWLSNINYSSGYPDLIKPPLKEEPKRDLRGGAINCTADILDFPNWSPINQRLGFTGFRLLMEKN